MSYKELIINHYSVNWSDEFDVSDWHKGPVHQLPGDFCILKFSPTYKRNMWTYATCCMSEEDTDGVELFLFSSQPNETAVEILYAIAHFHRTGSRLGLGHTINFGKGIVPNSPCTHGLVSLPYLDGPQLETMRHSDGGMTHFYWLLPVTQKEVAFKRQKGLEELEQRFENKEFDYLDPFRESVV